MAARLNPSHDARTREKIKVSQLLNRLQRFALGDAGVEMDANRLRAAEVLLRKALPDLSAVTIGGDENAPLLVQTIRRVIHDPRDDA